MLSEIKKRIMTMIGRCVLMAAKDNGNFQTVQIKGFAGEVLDDVERLQNFGLASNPPKGCKGIVVSVGSNRDDSVALVMDHSGSRPKNLEEGETVVFDFNGQKIYLKKDGSIIYLATNDHKFEGKSVQVEVSEKASFVTPKFKVENETAELVQTIRELIETLEGAQVLTLLGFQPIIPGGELFTDLKLKVQSFEEG